MATELFLQRARTNSSALCPASQMDAETLAELPIGVDYRASLTRVQGRSIQHHRLLWALLSIARDNYAEPITTDAVLDVVKLRTGMVKVIKLATGELIMTPASISFAKLTQDEFNLWFPRACEAIARDFLNGIDPLSLRKEVEERAHGRRAA